MVLFFSGFSGLCQSCFMVARNTCHRCCQCSKSGIPGVYFRFIRFSEKTAKTAAYVFVFIITIIIALLVSRLADKLISSIQPGMAQFAVGRRFRRIEICHYRQCTDECIWCTRHQISFCPSRSKTESIGYYPVLKLHPALGSVQKPIRKAKMPIRTKIRLHPKMKQTKPVFFWITRGKIRIWLRWSWSRMSADPCGGGSGHFTSWFRFVYIGWNDSEQLTNFSGRTPLLKQGAIAWAVALDWWESTFLNAFPYWPCTGCGSNGGDTRIYYCGWK